MYAYGCTAILTTEIKNRIDQEIIEDFTELTTDLKIFRINPGLHFMNNKASTAFKISIKTMDIKY